MIDYAQIIGGVATTLIGSFILWVCRSVWKFKGDIDSAFIKIRYLEFLLKEATNANVSNQCHRANFRANGTDASVGKGYQKGNGYHSEST